MTTNNSEAEALTPQIVAYCLNAGALRTPLVPAARNRDWMQSTNDHFANRCLPLLIANQAGWMILNGYSFRARWNGSNDRGAVSFLYDDDLDWYPAGSIFGYGIVTFNIPYLFRTSDGYNLLVRGPANSPKDGISPLEGVVETDWAVATFTMNWQFTRPDQVVAFGEGEPICMIVPQKRHELERFRARVSQLDSTTELASDYRAWALSRRNFTAWRRPTVHGKSDWQRHYFQGTHPSGLTSPVHQTKLEIATFGLEPSELKPSDLSRSELE